MIRRSLAAALAVFAVSAGTATALPPALSDVREVARIYPDLVIREYQSGDISFEAIRKMARTRWMADHPCSPETIARQQALGQDPWCATLADYALKQVGTPYVWGGSSPGGFDCSGLVYWSAQQMGVTLPRTTYGLMSYGTEVDPGAMLPGDLIFPHDGHVQIYIGNGQVVHSPHAGAQVHVEPVGSVMTVRRVV